MQSCNFERICTIVIRIMYKSTSYSYTISVNGWLRGLLRQVIFVRKRSVISVIMNLHLRYFQWNPSLPTFRQTGIAREPF